MPRIRRSEEFWAVTGGLLGVFLVVGAAAVGLDRLDFEEWSGILTLTALVAMTLPVLSWLSSKEGDQSLMRLLVFGMIATVVGVVVRYFVVKVVYNDVADAGVYSDGAAEIAKLMKNGVFTSVPPNLEGRPPETQRVALVLSFFYLVTGASRWAGSVVFAWMAFGGRLLMWRALKLAVPEADHRRYLLLLLFFPSLLYWPASIGKEALMMLALGVVSYGAALLLSDKVRAGSIVVFVGGVAGLVVIRPHYGALAVMALGVGSLVGTLRGVGGGAGLRSTLVRVVALGVLLVVAVVVLSQTARFLAERAVKAVSVVRWKRPSIRPLRGLELRSASRRHPRQTPCGGGHRVLPAVRLGGRQRQHCVCGARESCVTGDGGGGLETIGGRCPPDAATAIPGLCADLLKRVHRRLLLHRELRDPCSPADGDVGVDVGASCRSAASEG